MPNSRLKMPFSAFGLWTTTTCMDAPRLSCENGFCSIIGVLQPKGSIYASGRVSTTTSAPFRVEMVMQSEPSAYSLLTPSG